MSVAMINYVPHAYSNLESFFSYSIQAIVFLLDIVGFLFCLSGLLSSLLFGLGWRFGKSGFIHGLFCRNLLLVKSISLLF